MKLSYIQIALGVLIVLAGGYITWWMLFNASFQMEAPMPGGSGWVSLAPEHEALANAARYGSVLLLCLGIIVAVTGFLQTGKAPERVKKLAVAQLAAGALTIALAFFIGLWGFPTEFVSRTAVNNNLPLRIFSPLEPSGTYAVYMTFILALLGVVVLVIAITQLLTLKRPGIFNKGA
ncbi:MAG: hypothetical protein ABR886_09190 [Dehalococcoidales bacterium]|jgi:hypothetical protein